MTKLEIHPVTLREAREFVRRHHRHHKPPQGGLFAVGVAESDSEEPCGVAIVGRPVARLCNDGYTAEVTRVCTLGQPNACSMLYRACWRAARGMGYRKLITYTLAEEVGTSCVAAGMRCLGECGGGTWSRTSRPRVDMHPQQKKMKWEIT